MVKPNRLAGAALALSAVALVSSLAALLRPTPRDGYAEIVDELAETLQPVYKEFGLRCPLDKPTSIREALGPLLEMATALDGDIPEASAR